MADIERLDDHRRLLEEKAKQKPMPTVSDEMRSFVTMFRDRMSAARYYQRLNVSRHNANVLKRKGKYRK